MSDVTVVEIDHDIIQRLSVSIGAHHPHHGEVLPVQVGLGGVGVVQVYGPACDLMGWSLFSVAGAQAVLHDGDATGGGTVALVTAAANVAATSWLGPQGLRCVSGVGLQSTAGIIAGVLYIRPLRAIATLRA